MCVFEYPIQVGSKGPQKANTHFCGVPYAETYVPCDFALSSVALSLSQDISSCGVSAQGLRLGESSEIEGQENPTEHRCPRSRLVWVEHDGTGLDCCGSICENHLFNQRPSTLSPFSFSPFSNASCAVAPSAVVLEAFDTLVACRFSSSLADGLRCFQLRLTEVQYTTQWKLLLRYIHLRLK